MAILCKRKRVIETFVNKDLAKASPKMINNTDAYRALQGEFVYKPQLNKEFNNGEIEKMYEEYKKLTD